MNVIYIGPEVDGLWYGCVYDWRSDQTFSSLNRVLRKISTDYNGGHSWWVLPEHAPAMSSFPDCPACYGQGWVYDYFEVNYGPHPDAPEYGDVIQKHEVQVDCPYCRGTTKQIDWSGELLPQKYPVEG